MSVEAKRGCGYRKVGGLYMVGSGVGKGCDRLPIELTICPCCSHGIKQTRGWTWVDIAGLVGGDHAIDGGLDLESTGPVADRLQVPCGCSKGCPLCHNVKKMGRGGLLWIGAEFYPTIEEYELEARMQGISRRVQTVPRGFEVGKTWVLLAHPRGVIKPTGDLTAEYVPAIFKVWKPERLERIYKESDRNSEAVAEDIKRGITPVFVPDNDPDHQPGKKKGKKEEDGPTLFDEE